MERYPEDMEYTKLNVNDQDENGNGRNALSMTNNVLTLGGTTIDWSKWKLKIILIVALALLMSSQSILIVWSKRNGKYNYSITTSNFMVETLKCGLSLLALARIWRSEGVTEDNMLSTTLDEVIYYILEHVDAQGSQILKNLNVISTGVLYRIILKKEFGNIQWAALIFLCVGCSISQIKPSLDVFQNPVQGWVMAIVMALLSGLAGVYTEATIKKHPSRNINVQNFFLYIYGMLFSTIAIMTQDFDAVMNKGFFYGYSFITVLMILNQALSGLAVSMVMKYADNIVKLPHVVQVYSTLVAMLFTAFVSYFLFGFHLSLAFTFDTIVVIIYVYLHTVGKEE